ncbi:hypothetical protein [Burkholderia sp. BCC1630]|uniref:hypothetical protein n=1 Tax=Burkholderia sp. BCC1630 TaxID=2676304 RepID=UPI00158F2EAE|nr:hypothetical protein [Burkholderia sp. BCC1630]
MCSLYRLRAVEFQSVRYQNALFTTARAHTIAVPTIISVSGASMARCMWIGLKRFAAVTPMIENPSRPHQPVGRPRAIVIQMQTAATIEFAIKNVATIMRLPAGNGAAPSRSPRPS